MIFKPQKINNLKNIKKVSCGENHCLSLDNNGEIYSWGQGNKGQLGHGNKCDVPIPQKIKFSQSIKDISCGALHTNIVTINDDLFVFGKGNEGQLGLGNENISPTAFHLNPLENLFFKKNNYKLNSIKSSGYQTFALISDLN